MCALVWQSSGDKGNQWFTVGGNGELEEEEVGRGLKGNGQRKRCRTSAFVPRGASLQVGWGPAEAGRGLKEKICKREARADFARRAEQNRRQRGNSVEGGGNWDERAAD